MQSAVFDLVGQHAIEKGLPWQLRFTRYAGPAKTPVDLTGLSARLEIFDALVPGAPILTLRDTTGDITLGGMAGTVAADLSGAASAAITAKHLRYRLFFVVGGVDHLYMRGRLGLLEGDV